MRNKKPLYRKKWNGPIIRVLLFENIIHFYNGRGKELDIVDITVDKRYEHAIDYFTKNRGKLQESVIYDIIIMYDIIIDKTFTLESVQIGNKKWSNNSVLSEWSKKLQLPANLWTTENTFNEWTSLVENKITTPIKKQDKIGDELDLIVLDIIELFESNLLPELKGNYIDVISSIYNTYIDLKGIEWKKMQIARPDYINQLNEKYINNTITVGHIRDSSYKQLYSIFLNLFRKPKTGKHGLIQGGILESFTQIQERINLITGYKSNYIKDFSLVKSIKLEEDEDIDNIETANTGLISTFYKKKSVNPKSVYIIIDILYATKYINAYIEQISKKHTDQKIYIVHPHKISENNLEIIEKVKKSYKKLGNIADVITTDVLNIDYATEVLLTRPQFTYYNDKDLKTAITIQTKSWDCKLLYVNCYNSKIADAIETNNFKLFQEYINPIGANYWEILKK